MNVDSFVRQIETMYGRLTELYHDAAGPSFDVSKLMPSVFQELGIASEKLQIAAEELVVQYEEVLEARNQVEEERLRYQELFEFSPEAYLVLDIEGVIREANRAAATLLNIEQKHLIGKPLAIFVPEENRRDFRSDFNNLKGRERVQEWMIRLQPRNDEIIDAVLMIGAIRNRQGQQLGMRVCLRDVSERKRIQAALEKSYDYDPIQDRRLHTYTKGEIIPLIPQAVWLVCEGVVKLSTLSESGEEVIVGFAGPSTPFGAGMTSLQIYQATALSDMRLVCIPLTEIAMSPPLMQALLPKFNQRLRQAELLLAIAGQRRVKERLQRLLLLLKQEIGQPVARGTRFCIRLTHEELAAACCTTRVTITRELNKLQRQEKIFLDSERHIILKHGALE